MKHIWKLNLFQKIIVWLFIIALITWPIYFYVKAKWGQNKSVGSHRVFNKKEPIFMKKNKTTTTTTQPKKHSKKGKLVLITLIAGAIIWPICLFMKASSK